MRLIDLVVPLSDELQCSRFVERCLFVDIAGSEAAVLSTWRWMWKRSFCVVLSLPEHGDPAGAIKQAAADIRRFVRRRFRKLPVLPPVETYLVLGCRSQCFDQLRAAAAALPDRSPFHLNRIAGVVLVDEERFRSSAEDGAPAPAATGPHYQQIAGIVNRWCEQARSGVAAKHADPGCK